MHSSKYHQPPSSYLSLLRELWPLCRSIMGPGIRDSFSIIEKYHPDFRRLIFNTGDAICDWEVPQEWTLNNCFIEHIDSGRRYCTLSASNLSVVGYSVPVDITLPLSELQNYIYTEPTLPDAIPYITSYYNKRWGFCMTQTEKDLLTPGLYRAFIDSSHSAGELHLTELVLPGLSTDEIFITSYLCHPSMANNELSGPVVMSGIIDYLKEQLSIQPLHYTYRFLLGPETIGPLAYLSKNLSHLKSNVICGFNLSCVGDERAYSHVSSRQGDSLSDKALISSLMHTDNFSSYPYTTRGSDERQYCWPGVDLPLSTFCRSKFGTFPEYHTSLDTIGFVTETGLRESIGVICSIIDAFELGIYPISTTVGEPFMTKYNLGQTLSRKQSKPKSMMKYLNLLAYSDGLTSIFDICLKTDTSLSSALSLFKDLHCNDLVSFRHS